VAAESSQRWLARLSFVLAGLAIATLLAVAGLRSAVMAGVAIAGAAVSLAAGYWFLSHRGIARWLSLVVFALSPITVIIVYAFAALLWVAILSAGLWLLAAVTARAALTAGQPDRRMTEHADRPRPERPFLILNPMSGGGKVSRFDLKAKAEALGATVFLLDRRTSVDVAAVADEAVARGADLLGVAGGDGTQGLVAGVAARHGIPFMVITAGTRNHFAADLGLDRDNPAACLDALADGVELQVDLGVVGGRTFVNNASFGAYAEVVDAPAYRNDKLATTLNMLPDLLQGERGAQLRARADGVEIDAPQALLVANNPYGTGDLAGLSRRAQLDSGVLSVVGVRVASARQAAGLFRGRHATGAIVLTARNVAVTADTAQIPVGVDGEALCMTVPVECAIRPRALRVRVPRNRPGVRQPKSPLNWAELRRVAAPARPRFARRQHGGLPRADGQPDREMTRDPSLRTLRHPARAAEARRRTVRQHVRRGCGAAGGKLAQRAAPAGCGGGSHCRAARRHLGGAGRVLRHQLRTPPCRDPGLLDRPAGVHRVRPQTRADRPVPGPAEARRGHR
jgi:diacylglycerol kinase family enzyme